MRGDLVRLFDVLKIRRHMASARDGLIHRLEGDRRTDIERRNSVDEIHLRLLIRFCLKRDSNALDVGASRGTFLEEICRVAPAGHHIAYEPIPTLHRQLIQRFGMIDVRKRALSNTDGMSTFVHVCDEALEGYSGLRKRPYPRDVETESLTVVTERLDEHLPSGWLPCFAKIDVEGAEMLVLEGGLRTFREAKPIIAFEHGAMGAEDFGASDDELYRLVTHDIGLRLFDMDGVGPLSLLQFREKLSSGDRWNWVAHE